LLYVRIIVTKTGGVEEDNKRNLLLLLLNTNGLIPGDCVLQCKTGQYNTAQYKAIKYSDTHSRQPSIHKITKKSRTHIIPY